MASRNPRNLTIQEAAKASGLSEKAIRRRVERGTLASSMEGSRRLIPRAALERSGLLGSAAPAPDAAALAQLQETVDSLARRMDALEVWVLRSLNERRG